MSIPNLFRENMDEANTIEDSALGDIVWRKEAVDIVSAQIGDHFWRGNRANLDVCIRINAMFGQIIAQQIIMHRIIEGHSEFEALPHFGIALVFMLHRQRNRLTIHILNRRHSEGDGC